LIAKVMCQCFEQVFLSERLCQLQERRFKQSIAALCRCANLSGTATCDSYIVCSNFIANCRSWVVRDHNVA